MGTQNSGNRNKLKKRRFYKRKRFWFGGLLLALIAAAASLFFAERWTRPYREQANIYNLEEINDLEVPSIIYDRRHEEIGRIFVENRSVIPISDVSPTLINALIAGEDQRFRTHKGVDYIGILRAAYLNWKEGDVNQGASTITQQLARNAYNLKAESLRRNQSGYERKLVEAFLARRIEERYSKDQILEFYLNRIFFGSGYYGIRSAALGYYGKEPKDLNVIESASIVGAIKNPNNFSPLNSPSANQGSRNLVIRRMADLKLITTEEANRFVLEPVRTRPTPLRRGTSHLYERIADEIRREVGEDAMSAGGFRIYTSIDKRVQTAMETALEASYQRAENSPGYANPKKANYRRTQDSRPEYLQGAGLMIDHSTGEVIAHVGGRSYIDAPYDIIELGRRPLGTAFHPFLYAAALRRGITPASLIDDEPMDNRSVMVGGREGILGEWGMEVAQPRYEGRIPIRRALESSKIAASVRLATQTGLESVAETARHFGLPFADAELLPRIAVGWESASLKDAVRAISVFARNGESAPLQLSYVNRIENAAGQTVYSRKITTPERLNPIDEATSYQIHDMLRGSLDRGSASGLRDRLVEKPFTGAGKTGTTHDFSDTWFLGYNGRIACGIWLGFLQSGRTIHQGAFSRSLAMPPWEASMNAAATDFGGKTIPQPSSIVEIPICRVSGQRATPYCEEIVEDPTTGRQISRPSSQPEYFRKGTENIPFCSIHSASGPHTPPPSNLGIDSLAVIDTTPVRPREPILVGEDPYFTELNLGDNNPIRTRPTRRNVLDAFDLGEEESPPVRIPLPPRLDIEAD